MPHAHAHAHAAAASRAGTEEAAGEEALQLSRVLDDSIVFLTTTQPAEPDQSRFPEFF
jgi:hypothetical protein